MPRQNRVTPFSELIATPARGMWMGNRGVLHDDRGTITRRRWTTKAWITCLLEFKGRKRALMQPRRYTELFFLDEATGFAAGHRPCAECRRADFVRFRDAWVRANLPAEQHGRVLVGVIDDRLHAERVGPDRRQRRHRARLDQLPDGCLIALDHAPGDPLLVLDEHLWLWTPAGYIERQTRPRGVEVDLLTPPSIVAAIRAGYRPGTHPSASPFAGTEGRF